MRKRKLIIALLLALSVLLCGCQGGAQSSESTAQYPTFEFTHFASGGTEETYKAVILFEESCSTFTSYQVAFSSCTCRDSMVNYYSV